MKKKFNPIPKSMRDRKRYLSLEIKGNESHVKKLIYDTILELYGVIGFATIGFNTIKEKKNLIKVNRELVDDFIFVLNYINLREKDIKITVKEIFGTIKGFDKNETAEAKHSRRKN